MFQMKEEDNSSEIEPNEIQMSALLKGEFRMVIRCSLR